MDRLYLVILRRRYILIASVLFAIYMYGWSTKWSFSPTASHGLPTDRYFTGQADAILRGRLWIDEAANRPGGGASECFFVDGRCYGHWGLSPSLLRIPLLLIFGSFSLSLSNVMIPLAAGIALCAALDLCRLIAAPLLSQQSYVVFMLTGTIVLGPGSALILIGDPYVYQESLVWSVAGVVIAINLFYRWWLTNQTNFLVATIIACSFAAGSKATSAFVGIPLAMAVALKYKGRFVRQRPALIMCGLLAMAPVVVNYGTFVAKFGQLTADGATYRYPPGLEEPTPTQRCPHTGIGPKFIPTNMFTYLRPDAARLFKAWPYVRFRFGWCEGPNAPTFLWPINAKEPGVYVEKTTSVPVTMPVPLVATVASLLVIAKRRRCHQFLILASAATLAVSTTVVSVLTSRYLADFYPLMAVGFAFSAFVFERIRKRDALIGVGLVAALLAAWSLLANASLATRYFWIYS